MSPTQQLKREETCETLVRETSIDRRFFDSLAPDEDLPLKQLNLRKKNSLLKMAEVGSKGQIQNYDFCENYNSRGRGGRLTITTQYTFGGEQAQKRKPKILKIDYGSKKRSREEEMKMAMMESHLIRKSQLSIFDSEIPATITDSVVFDSFGQKMIDQDYFSWGRNRVASPANYHSPQFGNLHERDMVVYDRQPIRQPFPFEPFQLMQQRGYEQRRHMPPPPPQKPYEEDYYFNQNKFYNNGHYQDQQRFVQKPRREPTIVYQKNNVYGQKVQKKVKNKQNNPYIQENEVNNHREYREEDKMNGLKKVGARGAYDTAPQQLGYGSGAAGYRSRQQQYRRERGSYGSGNGGQGISRAGHNHKKQNGFESLRRDYHSPRRINEESEPVSQKKSAAKKSRDMRRSPVRQVVQEESAVIMPKTAKEPEAPSSRVQRYSNKKIMDNYMSENPQVRYRGQESNNPEREAHNIAKNYMSQNMKLASNRLITKRKVVNTRTEGRSRSPLKQQIRNQEQKKPIKTIQLRDSYHKGRYSTNQKLATVQEFANRKPSSSPKIKTQNAQLTPQDERKTKSHKAILPKTSNLNLAESQEEIVKSVVTKHAKELTRTSHRHINVTTTNSFQMARQIEPIEETEEEQNGTPNKSPIVMKEDEPKARRVSRYSAAHKGLAGMPNFTPLRVRQKPHPLKNIKKMERGRRTRSPKPKKEEKEEAEFVLTPKRKDSPVRRTGRSQQKRESSVSRSRTPPQQRQDHGTPQSISGSQRTIRKGLIPTTSKKQKKSKKSLKTNSQQKLQTPQHPHNRLLESPKPNNTHLQQTPNPNQSASRRSPHHQRRQSRTIMRSPRLDSSPCHKINIHTKRSPKRVFVDQSKKKVVLKCDRTIHRRTSRSPAMRRGSVGKQAASGGLGKPRRASQFGEGGKTEEIGFGGFETGFINGGY